MLCSAKGYTQKSSDLTTGVQLTLNPVSGELSFDWRPVQESKSQFLYRKGYTSFGRPIILDKDQTHFVDTLEKGRLYEYKLASIGRLNVYDYLSVGIEVEQDFLHNPRPVLLIVEKTMADSLVNEIITMKEDWLNEGRSVYEMIVAKDKSVVEIRDSIKQLYKNTGLGSVVLLGHVPVPYSGNTAWDGHGNHTGAWPADVYYATVRGIWTDFRINNNSPSRQANKNIPNDGKFDQNTVPAKVELAVGRIDMSNLPAFSLSETELTRKYLNKLHTYKTGKMQVVNRALIDDNFGYFRGEAFAQCGWRNFNVFFHPDSIYSKAVQGVDYFPELEKRNYLWSYGCGGGNYRGANGIGKTDDYASIEVQTIFNMMFGSYFGDWDVKNNFLRAALASGTCLTNCWAGRPIWFIHHMAMGYSIGFSTMLTQNNNNNNPNTYVPGGIGRGACHVSLLGDPTLRMYMFEGPSNLLTEKAGNQLLLSWNPSPDKEILGYHIYTKNNIATTFSRVTDEPVKDTSYLLSLAATQNGAYNLLVRAVKLQRTPMGSFYNLSPGIRGSYKISTKNYEAKDHSSVSCIPNPARDKLFVIGLEAHKSPAYLEILSTDGKLVDTHIFHSRNCVIPLDGLPKGLYFLRITQDLKSKYISFIKQ